MRQRQVSRAIAEYLEARCLLAATPSNVRADRMYYGSTTIRWDDVANETGYRIYYSIDQSNWTALTPAVDADLTSREHPTNAGQKYYYYVVSLENGVESAPSAIVQPRSPQDLIVQVSAQVVSNGIQLDWKQLATPITSEGWGYNVYRKSRTSNSWGTRLNSSTLSQSTLSYLDTMAAAGSAYEYRIERVSTAGLNANGYVYAGRSAPLAGPRGTVLLVIDQTVIDNSTYASSSAELVSKIERLKQDLVGDGWSVKQIEVDRDADDPDDATAVVGIKTLINNEYLNTTGGLQSIFLIGHVPVPYSGTNPWDGHREGLGEHQGAWPSDAYYATGLGTSGYLTDWVESYAERLNSTRPKNNNRAYDANNPDGKFDANYLPSANAVPLGRIDFSDLPGMSSTFSDHPATEESEIRLLSRYLDKDHLWRTGAVTAEPRALIDDQFGMLADPSLYPPGATNDSEA